jgi:precorrin-2 methylase
MAAGDTPSDAHAARVARTGIALVHEGELILPAAGGEAEGEQALSDSSAVVIHRFPVEVEVRNVAPEVDADAIADLALRRLARGLRTG